MAYELQIFKCPHGGPDTFWTLGELYTHHLDHHERPLPGLDHVPHVLAPPVGGVPPTACEIARAGHAAVLTHGTR